MDSSLSFHLGIFLSSFIILCLYCSGWNNNKLKKLVNGFPGPRPTLPFIGNILILACKPEGKGGFVKVGLAY
jgi:hypothetical protein